MQRYLMKSKIHRATITSADLHYEGSLTVDENLLEAADLLPHERVEVVNINNGSRLNTYVIPGPRGSGIMQLNGAAARRGAVGDLIIVISYGVFTAAEAERHSPRVVLVDRQNRITRPPLRAET